MRGGSRHSRSLVNALRGARRHPESTTGNAPETLPSLQDLTSWRRWCSAPSLQEVIASFPQQPLMPCVTRRQPTSICLLPVWLNPRLSSRKLAYSTDTKALSGNNSVPAWREGGGQVHETPPLRGPDSG